MCGILVGKKLSEDQIHSISYRGIEFSIKEDNGITMCHHRLPIQTVDGDSWSQPIEIGEKKYMLFNGEIFNYPSEYDSNEISDCSASSGTLQSAYDNGNTILTTTGRNIDFTLGSSLATSTSFSVTNAGTAPALILNDTVSGSTGSALLVQSGGNTKLTITELGAISTTGNISTTGTEILSSANGITISAGGASITGGINNNAGGITNTGAIAGVTTITASGTVQGANVNATSALQLSGTDINTTGTLSNVAYKGQNNSFTVGQTIGGLLTVSSGGASITGGIDNTTGGITNTGAISGATNITASGTIQGATINGTSAIQLNGTNINTTGTLTNVAYKGQNNNFTTAQTIGGLLTVSSGGLTVTAGGASITGGKPVIFGPVWKPHHICILLYTARFAQI